MIDIEDQEIVVILESLNLTFLAESAAERHTGQALLVHPLGPDVDQALAVLEDMLTTHLDYLSNFGTG